MILNEASDGRRQDTSEFDRTDSRRFLHADLSLEMKEHSMTPVAGTDYLETEVMTATPQRLQLMLIEAAIRSASQARPISDTAEQPGGLTPILRAQRIMAELLTGLNPEIR